MESEQQIRRQELKELLGDILCNDFGICPVNKKAKEQEKKQKAQYYDEDKPIPYIKVGNTVIECDWRTRECKILKTDGTPVSVGTDDEWVGVVEGDTIKSVHREKLGNYIEQNIEIK